LRDYGHDGQIGLEKTPEEFVQAIVGVFREVWRVLKDDGTLWLNLGDSYAANNSGNNGYDDGRINRDKRTAAGVPLGAKPKDLLGIPWRVAFALQDDGWYLRSDIIWHKPNPMPESVTDRPTKSHEYIFLLTKSPRYYYDQEAVREPHSREWWKETVKTTGGECPDRNDGGNRQGDGTPAGRNRRTVWTVATKPYSGAHFATFPPALIEPCILAGCPPGGVVLDPFMVSGTVAQVAIETGRNWLGVELNPEYIKLAEQRIAAAQPALIAPVGDTPAPLPTQINLWE
jgi:site-specific DNA-methyltransferase (adenine-specific)